MLINLVPHTSKHLHVLKLHNHPIPMTVATHLHSNLFHWHFKCRFNAPTDLRFVGLWFIRSGFGSSEIKMGKTKSNLSDTSIRNKNLLKFYAHSTSPNYLETIFLIQSILLLDPHAFTNVYWSRCTRV